MRLDHIGASVEDLDSAIAFFDSAFGFQPEVRFELPKDIRGAMLAHPDGSRLELFERPESKPGIRAADPLEAHATRGYSHFALSAPDIDSVYERAIAAGARKVWEPQPSPEPGVRFAYMTDPDGNLIELVERG
jgi:catechol 2,3-dioxygenase-like lactoylglutathione lyase family enzyme